MSTKTVLKILFGGILLTMLVCSAWASANQPVWQWGGLKGPDRYWTWATLADAYCGFLTFYVWLFFKEARWLARIGWFIAIMLLGNMAMATYMLWQLARLRSDQSVAEILLAKEVVNR